MQPITDAKTEEQLVKLDTRITSEVSRLISKIDTLDVKFSSKFNLLYWMMGFILASNITMLFKVF